MSKNYISYTKQTADPADISVLAEQYRGLDMAQLIGANENIFPFIINEINGKPKVMLWVKPMGMEYYKTKDPVLLHALVNYLTEHAYPQFESLAQAEQYARDHDWPLDVL